MSQQALPGSCRSIDRPQRAGFGSKADIEQFMRERGVAEFDELTEFPPLRFAHIVGYAGTYYSYLFANCIAAEVWGVQGGNSADGVTEGTLGSGWPSRPLIDLMRRSTLCRTSRSSWSRPRTRKT